MKPMSNVLELFKISVTFGIIIITLGIAINIINALKDKNYLKALFDKSGLLTGMIYWLAIALITKSLTANISVKPVYLYLIACGFAAMFLKPLIEAALKNKKAKNAAAGTHKESIFASCLESLIDILEIIMGYLANTVSFIRIAAFSLAHAGLFFAVFKLSEILKGVAANSLSILIIILGNILIILLEGMVVTIQSLRLNYYEFFSKFFVSGKQVFKPLTIESR
jgi:V/A-type H+-transporting ATPase subunit I